MATSISTQDLIDVKRDIDDIGKAVNEKVIVSPRYGEDFKSLPMIAADGQTSINSFEVTAQNTINNWESAIALITQEGGVPALAVSDASGKTQQQINNNIAAKILRASEIGLTKWTDFKKPPYTTQEYEQAYNNGVNLTNAIKAAYDAGYNQVVLERGNYPLTYTSADNPTQNERLGAIKLWGLTGMTFDLNSSILFAIFDSDNRSPYTSVSTNPYELAGSILTLKDTFGVVVKNGEFRGDHYNRSYTNAAEKQTENTTGVFILGNNRHSKIESCSFHGFRGDGISGQGVGETLGADATTSMNIWRTGGINSSGGEIAEAGAYRTSKIDISGKVIVNNQINIGKIGYLRASQFRSEFILVAFFNNSGAFISSEMIVETQSIFLPTGTRYVQFVAYEDERKTATVTYGERLNLRTGMSQYLHIDNCDFYRNHRGCISNLVDQTHVSKCRFFDTGIPKAEIPLYSSTTRYAINFEDVYVGNLSVIDCEFDNVGSAILAGCRSLTAHGNKFKNVEFSVFGLYDTAFCDISGNYVYSAKFSFVSLVNYTNLWLKRFYTVHDNVVLDCRFIGFSDNFNGRTTCLHHNNRYENVNVNFSDSGEGRTIYSHDNIYINPTPSTTFKNMASVHDEQIILAKVVSGSNRNIIEGTNISHSNVVKSISDLTSMEVVPNTKQTVCGVRYNSLHTNFVRAIMTIQNNAANNPIGYNDLQYDDCIFDAVRPTIRHNIPSTNPLPVKLNFNRTKFVNSAVSDEVYLSDTLPNVYYLDLVFEDCDIDLSNINTFVLVSTNVAAFNRNITFRNCNIFSSTDKNVRLCGISGSNVVISIDNCSVKNVKFTDPVVNYLKQAATAYDPPSLAAGAIQSTTLTLTGAVVGDAAVCSFSLPLGGTRMWAEVTATNTVTVYHQNPTNAAVDLLSGTLTVKLI